MRRSALIVVAALLGACGFERATPTVRYYTLAVDADAPSLPLPARVTTVTADPPYRTARIAYRLSPYQLDYYDYHRWAAPPRQLLRAVLRDHVERGPAGGPPAIEVAGQIRRLEEVDGEDGPMGALTLALAAHRGGVPFLERVYAEQEPAERKTPEAVAAAISRALGRVLARFAADLEAGAGNGMVAE